MIHILIIQNLQLCVILLFSASGQRGRKERKKEKRDGERREGRKEGEREGGRND